MSADIDIQIASTAPSLPSEAELRLWAMHALAGDQPTGHAADEPLHAPRDEPWELVIRIVDEPEARELNATYRQRDYATNVLSFPFESPPGLDLPVLGDLVICAPVVLAEAAAQGKAPAAHWAHLVIHGVLHLKGHDHIEEQAAQRMESLETALLGQLHYPDPYAS